ncbi:MAG: SpoIIE family protein phosphatase [Candidatus Eremiobacteraeota bacterium]|nr:SpoIIE family protein phosphatase [Candidatus Eremiobacteraeota bacterium]
MRRLFGRGADAKKSSAVLGPGTLSGPAFTAATVLAIALVVSIVGSLVTYVRVNAAYTRQNAIALAEQELQACIRDQLDEEAALREFLASGQRIYLRPYYRAHPDFETHIDQLQRYLERASLPESYPIAFDLRRSHAIWEKDVAHPLITHPSATDVASRVQKGRLLTDQIRRDSDQLTILLDDQSAAARDAVKTLLLRAATLTAALMLLFGVSAIIADVVRSRTQVALERERLVGDTLQRAFLSGWDVISYLRVGTAYVSAARHVAVGGDLFDVHRIDARRCLLVVADVSGKGLEAAVDTAFVKYSLRTLVEDYHDPTILLRKFNAAFIKSIRDETSFVSLFVGVLDSEELTLRYASAGHSPVYLRRGDEVRQLPVTGSLIGLRSEDDFPTIEEMLLPHDLLVLATDGFTEARDTAGMMIDDEGAMRIIREAPTQPQKLADYVVAAVTRTSGGRIADDLALLVIELAAPEDLTSSAALPSQSAAVTPIGAAAPA